MAEGGDLGQAMLEGCLDCGTGAWYIINVYDGRKQTRCRADSEVSQVLEDAYKKRKKYAVYQDKDTKSTIRADIENNLLYIEGIHGPHAYIERVVEKRKEPLKENKEPMSTVVDSGQSRQTISNNKDAAEDMLEGCLDCGTGVWYIINIYEGRKQTRYRADSEVSQVLEDAYKKRKKYAVYQDKDIKSTIKANLETNFLYVEGMQFPHAYIERVVEKMKEPLKKNKEPMSTVVDGSQSRQTISNIRDAAEFQSLDPARHRELNDKAAKMIDKAGQADQKLTKDLDECSRKIQEFSRKFYVQDIVQLGKILQEKNIERVFLTVERVEISNCILVQNL